MRDANCIATYVSLCCMNVNEAVRNLRKHLRRTQQSFASELGISISALNNYERSRRPESRRMHIFYLAAKQAAREDLARVFWKALSEMVVEPYSGPALRLLMLDPQNPGTRFELRCMDALALVLHSIDYRDLAPAVLEALARVIQRNDELEGSLPHVGLRRAVFEQNALERGFQIQAAVSPAARRGKKQ